MLVSTRLATAIALGEYHQIIRITNEFVTSGFQFLVQLVEHVLLNSGLSWTSLCFLQIPPRDGHPCSQLMVGNYIPHSGLSPPSYYSCTAHNNLAPSESLGAIDTWMFPGLSLC